MRSWRLISRGQISLHRDWVTRRALSTAPDHLTSDIEGEPLHRYTPGGYHPVHLQDTFNNGQYTVLHKLGWGGYGTVWLAKDHLRNKHVAIKVMVSEMGSHLQEADIYRRMSDGPLDHPGRAHVARLLDSFLVAGPNGSHTCLVTELLGISVASATDRYKANRLPGKIAWQVARQVTQGISYMHAASVVHGDLHPGNILFTATELDILKGLGRPVRADVIPSPRKLRSLHLPKYLVETASLPLPPDSSSCIVKIADFGSSFINGNPSPKMRCPLAYRAPEAVLTEQWGAKADIWSLSCTIFALIVGYPPFDSFLSNEKELVAEWTASLGRLPKELAVKEPFGQGIEAADFDNVGIPEWLRETYYDDDKKAALFTEDDLEAISQLLISMFRYRPDERPTSRALLEHPLLRLDPFSTR